MAWIKTIKYEDADAHLQEILMKTRMNYPPEYDAPVERASAINESIVDSHTLIPDALFHAFSTFSALMSPDLPLEKKTARNDCDDGLGDERLFLLTGISRRVSASRNFGRRFNRGSAPRL